MYVYIVTEHEPDCGDLPIVVKAVFVSESIASDFIDRFEQERDRIGEKSSDDLWWQSEAREVLEEIPEVEWCLGSVVNASER